MEKRTADASEQDRRDVLRKRAAWFEGQIVLDRERLAFMDGTWAKTNLARALGRCRRGERLRMGIPHGHWKAKRFIGSLTLRGMIALFLLSGPINRGAFEAHVEKTLVPDLRPGDVFVMDDLTSHKGSMVRDMIEAAGAALRVLPP